MRLISTSPVRRILIPVFLCIGSLLAAQAPNQLEAYFSFDNCTAFDDSGNGTTTSLIGNPGCSCGLFKSAYFFDGNDDAMFVVGTGVTSVFTTSDFTVSFYMLPKRGPTIGGTEVVLIKQETCADPKSFWVRYNPKTNRLTSAIRENDTLSALVGGSLDESRCWQHIALVRSNDRYTLYINGELADSRLSDARLDITSKAILKVSEKLCVLDNAYLGKLDEIYVFSRALSQGEVNQLMLPIDQIANADTLVYLGSTLQLARTATCAESVSWGPAGNAVTTLSGNTTPAFGPSLPGFYEFVFHYDSTGCQARDSVWVNVIDADTLDCTKIFLPNAFTPGVSAGRNDVFGISNPFSVDEFVSLEVFDRWGGQVFSARTAFDTWDGTFQGQALNPGVFLYKFRFRCKGIETVKSGSLTLIR